MDSIMNIKNYNFRNNILSKNNIPIFYSYYMTLKKIKYTFIHNNKIVNLDIKDINNMIAIPINFSNNLYEINFENKMILIRSKDFNNWLYIYNKWNNFYKYYNYLKFLNYHKIYFIIL